MADIELWLNVLVSVVVAVLAATGLLPSARARVKRAAKTAQAVLSLYREISKLKASRRAAHKLEAAAAPMRPDDPRLFKTIDQAQAHFLEAVERGSVIGEKLKSLGATHPRVAAWLDARTQRP